MNKKQKQYLVIVATVCLGVLIFLIPKVPSDKKVGTELTKADIKIAEAIKLVENSGAPMEGIMMLREVLNEDSTNVKAQWAMAQFSIRSGQYEKALNRLKKVIKFDKNSHYTEAKVLASNMAQQLGKTNEAILYIEEYIGILEDDSEEKELLEQRLKRLKELNKN